MSLEKSWEFVGSTGGWAYRLFDWLRRGLNRRLVASLIGELATCKTTTPVRVLEAGSGPGFATSLFSRQRGVMLAVCVDLDESALKEGRRRDASLQAVVADISRLPFAAGAFALVFNSSTVEHLPHPQTAVVEMARVCRREGRVFVGVPYAYGPLWFEPWVRHTRLGKWLGPVFDRRRLAELLGGASLRPTAVFPYFLRFFIGMAGTRP